MLFSNVARNFDFRKCLNIYWNAGLTLIDSSIIQWVHFGKLNFDFSNANPYFSNSKTAKVLINWWNMFTDFPGSPNKYPRCNRIGFPRLSMQEMLIHISVWSDFYVKYRGFSTYPQWFFPLEMLDNALCLAFIWHMLSEPCSGAHRELVDSGSDGGAHECQIKLQLQRMIESKNLQNTK